MTPDSHESALQPGWSRPRPDTLPRATYWPATMAFGITFAFWGLITSPVVLIAGGLAVTLALAGWIGELRRPYDPAPPEAPRLRTSPTVTRPAGAGATS